MTHAALTGERLDNNSNPIWCEQCGEAHAACETAECALCDDCFAEAMREELQGALGYKPCCFPVWVNPEVPAICLQVAGTEHDHCAK